tara:strand:+ start:723 stop:2447 length:1725 start_codon:yes stop_codon:yes gene_type:complete
MPDLSNTAAFPFVCEGGLVLNQSTFIMKPGQALELENFEPDIEGGYRRINGFQKFVGQTVPETASSTEPLLMVTIFNDFVIAARGQKIFSAGSTVLTTSIASSTGMTGSGTIIAESTAGFSSSGTLFINSEQFTYTGKSTTTFTGVTRSANSTSAATHSANVVVSETWTERDTGRTSATKYSFEKFNFDGNDKFIVVDGTNDPTVFNTSLSATDVTESSVEGAKHVVAFKNHMFYSGMSSTPQEVVFSQPFDEDAFSSGSGAGSIKVDDVIVGLKVFRDNLFIFCENRIFQLGGSSSSDFAVKPVTRKIGCINGDTIQEFAGDLIFLGPDGLRTVAGTARIGDVELGSISSNVQSLFRENLADSASFTSLVIPDKTQYRIFFSKEGGGETSTVGVVCVMKGQSFEFSKMRGIRPACTDTTVTDGDVVAIHGGFDGVVYRQDQGDTFDGELIKAKYRSPDLTFNDPGIRKHMQRVNINYAPESTIDADLFVRYDYESQDSTRPAAYPLDSLNVAGIYGSAIYGTTSYGGPTQPIVRKSVEGSGFAVALRVEDGATSTAPYSLKGFQLEYQVGARR